MNTWKVRTLFEVIQGENKSTFKLIRSFAAIAEPIAEFQKLVDTVVFYDLLMAHVEGDPERLKGLFIEAYHELSEDDDQNRIELMTDIWYLPIPLDTRVIWIASLLKIKNIRRFTTRALAQITDLGPYSNELKKIKKEIRNQNQ